MIPILFPKDLPLPGIIPRTSKNFDRYLRTISIFFSKMSSKKTRIRSTTPSFETFLLQKLIYKIKSWVFKRSYFDSLKHFCCQVGGGDFLKGLKGLKSVISFLIAYNDFKD